MTIHATFNPIGSTNPKDLIDNAQNLDYLILGPALLYPDRRGVNRLSWAGIEASFAAAQAARTEEYAADKFARDTEFADDQAERIAEFVEDQAERVQEFNESQELRALQFNEFMEATGYEAPIPYGPSILLDRTTKTVSYLGNEYRVRSEFMPLTTSNWAADEPKLKLIGDDSLRQNLFVNGAEINGFVDAVAPAYLKTVSDIINGLPVNLNRFVPRTKHSAIAAGTNTDNLITNIQEALYSEARQLVIGNGVYHYETDASSGLTLLMRPKVSMVGFGPGSILKNMGSGTAMTFLGDTTGDGPRATYAGSPTRMQSVTLKDFTIEGNALSLDGLRLSYTEKFGRGSPKLSNLIIKGHGRDGLFWTYGDGLVLDKCDLLYNGRHNLNVFENANGLQVFGGNISGAKTGHGAYLNQVASTCSFWGTNIHDNAGSALLAQRCEQPSMYGVLMNGNGHINANPAVQFVGDDTKKTVAGLLQQCLFGDNNPTGPDVLTINVRSVTIDHPYIFCVNTAKPEIFRLAGESRGVKISSPHKYYSNGANPELVRVVPGQEGTVTYQVMDDVSQNSAPGTPDESKQVDHLWDRFLEYRLRNANNILWQTRVTGSETAPFYALTARGKTMIRRDGSTANPLRTMEVNASDQWEFAGRIKTDLGFMANGSAYTDRPFQAGTQVTWWDTFGMIRTKPSTPTSAQDGVPLSTKVPIPASSTSAGAPGQWAANTNFYYAYIGDGTTHSWARSALATW